MSAPAGHHSRLAPRYVAKRRRAAERSRRADQGTVTEMARMLLREAAERPQAGPRRRAARLVSAEPVQGTAQVADAA